MNAPTRDDNTSPPDPKRPRLTPLPGPAPYSVPSLQGNNNVTTPSTPQLMGPPSARPQPSFYTPPQTTPRSTLPPTLNPSITPASVPEDRIQDAEQLQDALVSAGVDLKAEEFNLSAMVTPGIATATQSNPFNLPPYSTPAQPQQRAEEEKVILNRYVLLQFIDRIVAKQYNIPRIDNDVMALLSLSLEHRLRQLISQMCLLARHRTSPLVPSPSSRQPSGVPTLLDLARQERQKEESFQSRKRARTGDKDPSVPTPPAKIAPPSILKGSSSGRKGSRISSELTTEAQRRSMDSTVNVMLGAGRKKRYSWMESGGSAAGSPTPNSNSPGVVASPINAAGVNREDDKLRGRAVERAGYVTMKDALEAIEGDAGGEAGIGLGWEAGGKSLWKGWARVKD